MAGHRVVLCLLAALAIVTAPTTTSAAPTTPPPTVAAVTLPFAPPLDTPIRYDFEQRSEAGGVQRMRLRSVDDLTFRRADAGNYRLEWVTRSIAVEAPGPLQPMLEKVYGIGVNVPLLVTVSPEGAALAMENAPEIRALTDRMLTAMVGSLDSQFASLPAEGRATIGKMMAVMVDQQRQQSDAAFAESQMESPRMMFPGLAPLVPGVPTTREVEAESPLGGRIRFLAQVELRRYEPGVVAEVRVSSIANPEDARRATTGLMARLFAAIADPVARAKAEADFAAMGPMAISDEAVIVLSLPSGIPETMHYSKRIAIPGQPVRTDSRSFTRQK